ncbi:S4 domain-containing protein YaaA [Paenibacillus validus]|uniref:S4 domain-containing protein YaaA n=1 Tax=Paenibacillus validus TaxID=44253 RepID=A0A7X2ZEL2_9BACL|nr:MULTISPECIES: S4 domain-containing protein YaaA [Paenibacillus]MED4600603.1 S4 domain-containing protein YaaA [Paenibacillus validus]MED4605612.1 S4 domain-containing protein YaaA [Paenibacillus validus]MUG72890.1 S4 domain-containing protein YaaA [Paenibacillus validus]
MKPISIHTDYITLGQFLKLSDCISTGGQAKSFLQETPITINDEPDNRRGRKLVAGDIVKVQGCGEFQVVKGS